MGGQSLRPCSLPLFFLVLCLCPQRGAPGHSALREAWSPLFNPSGMVTATLWGFSGWGFSNF